MRNVLLEFELKINKPHPPCMIQLAFVSPGWTLAEKTTVSRPATSSALLPAAVIVTSGSGLPAKRELILFFDALNTDYPCVNNRILWKECGKNYLIFLN